MNSTHDKGQHDKGTGHWKMMRVTSLALIPLTLWFILSLLGLVGADQAQVQNWLKDPANMGAMLLFMGFGLFHSAYGLQEIVEDYVQAPRVKSIMLLLIKAAHLAAALFAAAAILAINMKA